ncbi:MAG TPA: hypothetical protein PLS50_06610, partial [Candidatus Dojkabacteria bacterium]|nr:hypothetical protein [Candidatus Dojkabacteria bacterium]
ADRGWKLYANFHISHIQKHLIWLTTPPNNKEIYYNYWSQNIDKIRQYSKNDLLEYLDVLNGLGIIEVNEEIRIEIQEKIIHSNRNYFNACPGLGLVYEYSSMKAIELDKSDRLVPEIKNKILEGLSILNKAVNFFKT